MTDLRIADGLVAAEDGGETFLLDTRSRRYYRLNRSGTAIWQALQHDAEPLAALAESYPSADPELLQRDVEAICAELLEAGLVEPSSA